MFVTYIIPSKITLDVSKQLSPITTILKIKYNTIKDEHLFPRVCFKNEMSLSVGELNYHSVRKNCFGINKI
jgi:hypothetical protein